MKNHKMLALALLAVMLIATGVAYAELVEGEVTAVDLAGNLLKVSKAAAEGAAAEEVSIGVNDTTTYSGEVTALAEVVEGDKVKIEAEKDAATGNWVAKSVDVAAIEEEAAA